MEDEFDFVLMCPAFLDFFSKKTLSLNTCIIKKTSFLKFLELFSTDNFSLFYKSIHKLCQYLVKVIHRRNYLIHNVNNIVHLQNSIPIRLFLVKGILCLIQCILYNLQNFCHSSVFSVHMSHRTLVCKFMCGRIPFSVENL